MEGDSSPTREAKEEELSDAIGDSDDKLNEKEMPALDIPWKEKPPLEKEPLKQSISEGGGDVGEEAQQTTVPDVNLLDHIALESILGKKKGKTIWDLAVEENKKIEQSSKYAIHSTEYTAIFVGSERSGKTSIIYKFIERTDPPKPTIALDYLYAKRTKGLDTGEELCHIWEVGSGILNAHLLEIPLNLNTIPRACLVLILDLNQLEKVDSIFETYLGTFRDFVKELAAGDVAVEIDLKKMLKKEAWKRLGENVQDKKQLSPFPVPFVIFGTKYDLFQNLETEKRKAACRYLRMLNVINGGFLHFVCNKIGKPRSVLNHVVFGSSISKTPVLDHTKPLYIPFGADSFEAITGIATSKQSVTEQFEAAKEIFHQHFPQTAVDSEPLIDPSKDVNFQEREIDALKEKKDLEFQIALKNWLASLKTSAKTSEAPDPFLLRDIQANIDLLNVESAEEPQPKESGFVIRDEPENEKEQQPPADNHSPPKGKHSAATKRKSKLELSPQLANSFSEEIPELRDEIPLATKDRLMSRRSLSQDHPIDQD